jgi:C4-dicarboxylate-specific signal transduction histidine kinase
LLQLLWCSFSRIRTVCGSRQQATPQKSVSTRKDVIGIRPIEEALRNQAELVHVSRITSLGLLTTSIAHEVRQPVAAALTNASAGLRWLATDPPNVEEARRTFGRIISDCNRANAVIGRVRALANKAPSQKVRLNLKDTILEAIALTRAESQKHDVLVQTRLAPDLPPVKADYVQLQQVILNLIINALEAMSEADKRPRQMVVSAEKTGVGVLVAVRDTGPGFDSHGLTELFDAFYTTKPSGLGIGLAISRLIVEAHGGRLWAEANTPQGAVFKFSLPVDRRCRR